MAQETVRIRLRNEIQLDDQMEVVDEVYTGQLTVKKDSLYLTYTNEDQEKVVIKAGQAELAMTRFSTPNTIMRFVAGGEAVVQLHTPMGIQHFVTQTSRYTCHADHQQIQLAYVLKPLDSEQIFARYEMEIGWE